MSYPFIIQGDNITVVVGSKPYTISKTHITYDKLVEAIKAGDWQAVADLVEPKQIVLNFGSGNVSIEGETLYWKDQPMHGAIVNRMIQMLKEGFNISPLVAFMHHLMENPSKRAVDELYGFLEKNNLPITPDGHFLAYKKVRGDYMDVHSGTMDNSVGQIVEMERNRVDDNKENVCSTGLHFCSMEYLKSFGGERTVIVKINPRDVVSIPTDYNNSKGRTCRYEVIGEVGKDASPADEFTKSVQSNGNSAGPKTGSTPFYHGYHDGYHSNDYDPGNYYSMKAQRNYEEGYDKGQSDYDNGRAARYVLDGDSDI